MELTTKRVSNKRVSNKRMSISQWEVLLTIGELPVSESGVGVTHSELTVFSSRKSEVRALASAITSIDELAEQLQSAKKSLLKQQDHAKEREGGMMPLDSILCCDGCFVLDQQYYGISEFKADHKILRGASADYDTKVGVAIRHSDGKVIDLATDVFVPDAAMESENLKGEK